MSSIISTFAVGSAIAEIQKGYANLQGGKSAAGAAGAASALQQLGGGQNTQPQDPTGKTIDKLVAQLDSYEFSKTAMDMAQAMPNTQTTGIGQSIAPADIGAASTAMFSAINVFG